MAKKKIVLAYSGGLDTSVMLKWLQEQYKSEVVSLTLDVGQGDDFKKIEEKAWNLGVENHYTMDVKKEFAVEYVIPAIKANALYMDTYPISSSLSRPLIAKKMVEVAEIEGAYAVAHGCTGKGNDQVRFDVTIKALNPNLKIIAPVREWKFDRNSEIIWAKEHNIPVPVTVDSPYSIDQNLWGRSIEGGVLEYPEKMAPKEIWEWTNHIEDTPNEAEYVTIGFEKGVPTSIDAVEMDIVSILDKMNKLAGKHGIGRCEHMEDRTVGLKSRETYEIPAAETILIAHKDLEKMVLTVHQMLMKREIDHKWTTLVYQGLWVDPLKKDLEAFINSTQENVTGWVTMKLHKGSAKPVKRGSENSLYDYNLTSFDVNIKYDQHDALGFISLWGLPSVTSWNLKRKQLEQKDLEQAQKVAPPQKQDTKNTK
ncbi:argininosuccinate synthase [Candidatus Bathyarchaeota archaeon]|nr:argininosuccinate synthase [Candidatus Bathyarchaeota archaeon]